MSVRNLKIEAPAHRESIKPVAISCAIGLAVCMVLMLLMAVLITAGSIPHSAIEPMALLAVSAGAFVSGYLCARAMRSNGLFHGAACGVVLTFVVLIAGLSAGSGFGVPGLFRVIFIMLSAMLGGVTGVNTRRRKR